MRGKKIFRGKTKFCGRRTTMASDTRELFRRIFEDIWNNKNLNAVDELIATNNVHRDPGIKEKVVTGTAAYKEFARLRFTAIPDLHFTLEEIIVDGQAAAGRWTATGTQQGDLPELPRTGRRFSVTGMSIARAQNGKFVETWSNWDTLGMLQQLGAIPTPAQTPGRAA
jgi:steroid delta-isomerase-like uncharacterized protein